MQQVGHAQLGYRKGRHNETEYGEINIHEVESGCPSLSGRKWY
jgi:hypothetical protein